MTKLTEHTVLARTRAQDLRSVRKLNAWGSELTDVSIVKKLPNVEVLSLSVNSISSLEDFSYCNNLQELYIRKNNITELGEIRHLKDLPKLKNLWLADNPCAECDDYRLTVIRALPQLQKLDNMPIRPDEIESAKKYGFPLEAIIPKTDEEEITNPVTQPPSIQNCFTYEENSVTVSESCITAESNVMSPNIPSNGMESVQCIQNSVRLEAVNHTAQTYFQEKISPEYSYPDKEDRRPLHGNSSNSTEVMSPSTSNHSGFVSKYQESFEREVVPDPEPFPDTPTGSTKEHCSPKCAFAPPYAGQRSTPRCERPTAIRMLPKGGKSRAANILSAVLCLIKELDWASLEVVDTAIHCQMEEMEEHHSS